MHGLVVLDESDNIIRNVILWNDGRTSKETEYLNTVIGKDKLSEYTANIAFAGFTAPKILWMKENEPENFKKISKIMLPKDYINYKLTGVHACDYSDASGMLLLDVKNKCWSKEMLDLLLDWIEKDDRRVNAKSLLGVLSMGIAKGMTVTLVADGQDETSALDALETFHPDRMASRILGMGDVLTLIEKAQEVLDIKVKLVQDLNEV